MNAVPDFGSTNWHCIDLIYGSFGSWIHENLATPFLTRSAWYNVVSFWSRSWHFYWAGIDHNFWFKPLKHSGVVQSRSLFLLNWWYVWYVLNDMGLQSFDTVLVFFFCNINLVMFMFQAWTLLQMIVYNWHIRKKKTCHWRGRVFWKLTLNGSSRTCHLQVQPAVYAIDVSTLAMQA